MVALREVRRSNITKTDILVRLELLLDVSMALLLLFSLYGTESMIEI